MRALPDGVHATPLDLPAVADLDALVDRLAGRVVPGSVVVGHSLDGMEAVYYGDRGHHPEVRAERLRAARVYGPERFAAHSVAIGARPDRGEFPAQAGVPVLIVGASDDLVVPTEEQRRWAEANGAGASGAGAGAVAGSNGAAGSSVTYVEIPETGHMLPVEAPDELAGAIVDWLRGLSG